MTRRLYLPLVLLLAVAGGWVLLRHHGEIGAGLTAAQQVVAAWVEARPVAAAVGFVAIAALGKVTPLPGGIAIMLTAGTLFGPVLGPLLAALGAALCALSVGAAGRWLLAEAVHRRVGHRIAHLEETVAEDGFNWLLAARLLPVLPAWLVNLVPVVFPIPLWKVFAATLVGLLPLSFVLGGIGDGLTSLAEAEAVPSDILLSPEVLVPLVGLAVVALVPIAVKRMRRKRSG